MAIYTSVLTGGINNHQTTSEEANDFATDFASKGVVGAITNTSGVAPATGAFAVNAQGTPDMTVAVTAGKAYVRATPSGQASQTLRINNNASANVTIAANSSGSTKYDWIYLSVSAANAAAPNVAGDNVTTLVASRSSSASTDNGTPPTYGYPLAVVTVANAASSITNGNITDIRNNVSVIGVGQIKLGKASITAQITTSSTTDTLATGLSVTVTVPTGGRSVKVTAQLKGIGNTTSGQAAAVNVWDGTVGGGTQLQEVVYFSTSAGSTIPVCVVAEHTPSAGVHTYNIGYRASANTAAIAASSVGPSFILVELI